VGAANASHNLSELTGKFKRSEHGPELLLAPGNDKSPNLICPDEQVGQSPGATMAFPGAPRHLGDAGVSENVPLAALFHGNRSNMSNGGGERGILAG
jgi:hypothetical protein